MTKYEIYTDDFVISLDRKADLNKQAYTSDVIREEYLQQDGHDPKLIASFDNLADARAYFQANYANYGDTRIMDSNNGKGYDLVGQLALLQEAEYDDDDPDFLTGDGGIWESAIEEIDELHGDNMIRFESLEEDAPHAYDAETIAAMSDKELVDEINRLPDWDADLLYDLIYRAYGKSPYWEVGDDICYRAARKLGLELK